MSRHTTYVPFIDGLRAIAVLSVIIYHLHGPWLPGGFTGVDIFFVISGYVVSAAAAQRGSQRVLPFLGYFYARRLFRIGPALVACLLVVTIGAILFIPYSWLSGTVQNTGAKAFFGLSNFVLARTHNDYFSPRADFNPFMHTWSLGVEEQFYLIFPWLFLPWLNLRRRVSFIVVGCGCVLSLAWAWHLGVTNPARAFYMISSRFWELGAGMFLFQAQTMFRGIPPRWRAAGAWAGAALLAAGLAVTAPASTPFPGGLLPVLGTVGLLACLTGDTPSLLRRGLEWAPLRFIGKISYSLYLWHWPVFVLFRWTSGLQDVAEYGCALAIVFALAIGSFYFIETPPRRFLPKWQVPRGIPIVVALATIGLTSAVASTLWGFQHQISLSTVNRHPSDWYPGKLPAEPATSCHLQHDNMKMHGMSGLHFYATGCAPGPRLFIVGDSHAAAYTTMAKLLALREGADVYLYSAGGCTPVSLLYPATPGCTAMADAALADALARARPGDFLFLPALRIPRLTNEFTIYSLAHAQAQAAAATPIRRAEIRAAVPLLRPFAAKGVKIILEAPTPVFKSQTFRCADWFDHDNPICAGGTTIPRAAIAALRAPILQGFHVLQAEIPGTIIWDPMKILCPGAICSEYRGNRPLFFDSDHLSGYANQLLEPAFAALLRSLGKPVN